VNSLPLVPLLIVYDALVFLGGHSIRLHAAAGVQVILVISTRGLSRSRLSLGILGSARVREL